MSDPAFQQCIKPTCGATYAIDDVRYACSACGSLLDVCYDWSRCRVPKSPALFNDRRGAQPDTQTGRLDYSGVWRFRELLPFANSTNLVTIGEGRTILQQADRLAIEIGHKPGRCFLQYEGFNPSGSFKDNGMAAAFTMARSLDRCRVGCASTGNTSASLAMFAGNTSTRAGEPIRAVVFVGDDKIALGKLAQALDHGAMTLQIAGDFDACMRLVREATDRLDLYLVNSINPFRLEGQKTIMYRVLEGLGWQVPDWIVVPGGNLGNTSAFGKAFVELRELGLIDRMPRLAVINAAGANTLYELFTERGLRWNGGQVDDRVVLDHYQHMEERGWAARTVATAIEIGRPVNLHKALRSLDALGGVVLQVSDEAILDAKALVGQRGYGCEPASAASVAGLRLLLEEQVIAPTDRVVCILTGHALKDPDATVRYHANGGRDDVAAPHANPPVQVPAEIEAIEEVLRSC